MYQWYIWLIWPLLNDLLHHDARQVLWFVVVGAFPLTRLELTRREALIWRSMWQIEKRMSIKSASRMSQMHSYLDVSTKLCVHLNLISLVDCFYKSDLICGRLEKQKESQLLELVSHFLWLCTYANILLMELKLPNNHLGCIYIYIYTNKWL